MGELVRSQIGDYMAQEPSEKLPRSSGFNGDHPHPAPRGPPGVDGFVEDAASAVPDQGNTDTMSQEGM